MGRKTCGFAKYSDKDSANRAIEVLNGQEIGGSTLKVVHAEPEVQRKRSRMGDWEEYKFWEQDDGGDVDK